MKTRKFRKSMLSAVVVLMAAIISLTGATYAWFTAGENAEVGGITAGVEQGSGLLISTDGSTWVSNVEYQLGEGFVLEALSTSGVVSGGELDFYRAALDTTTSPSKIKDPTLRTWTKKTAAEGNSAVVAGRQGFIAFDVYFNNIDQTAKNIVVTGGVTSGDANRQAIRVAYIVQGTLSGANSGDPNFDDDLGEIAWNGSAEGGSIKIIEPYANTHLTAARNEYATLMPDEDQNAAFKYFGIAGTFAGSIDRYTEVEDVLVPVTTIPVAEGSYDDVMFNIPQNTCLKLTVVVWLEGQDADCLNAISGGNLSFDIGFTIAQ